MSTTTGQAATYQRLRQHLDFLKLPAAAEALPGILDAARAQDASTVTVLEQLLAVEVETTQARRLASRLRFACLPTQSSLDTFDFTAHPASTRNSSASWPRCASSMTPAMWCSSDHPAPVRRCWPSGWPAPQPRPVTGSISPAPTSWPNDAARPLWRAGGPPACGSSADPACWSSTNSPTHEPIPTPTPTLRCSK